MAKTVNWNGFWLRWLIIFVFLLLLCATNAVVVFAVGVLRHNYLGGYLVPGLLSYMTNPRFWVIENGARPYRRDTWIIFLWPIKIPCYVFLMVSVAIYRARHR